MRPKSKDVTLAYRCPECGMPTYGMKGFLTLSGDLFKLKCRCEKSSSTEIRRRKDGKTIVTAPCLLCASNHSFTFDENGEYSGDTIKLTCPVSGLDVVVIGKAEDIAEEFKRSDIALSDILEENGFESVERFIEAKKADAEEKKNTIGDRVSAGELYNVISFFLSELNENGGIVCSCAPQDRKPECNVDENGLAVSCKCCGKKALVPFSTLLDPYSLAEIDRLVLR